MPTDSSLSSSTEDPGKRSWKTLLAFGSLIIIALFLLTYGNYQLAKQSPGGVDFLYRWLPTRSLLFEGNPDIYSEATTLQNQVFRYGRPALAGEVPCLFAYPFYVIGLYLPFALIEDFSLARSLWMTLLEMSHILIVLLTLHLAGYKPRRGTLLLLIIFSLFTSYLAQSLGNGNPSSLAVLLIMLSLLFIRNGQDRLAGIALAFSTIKPQLVILVFILICLWALSQRRWLIILYAFMTVVLLLAVSFIIQPTWFAGFLKQITLYQDVASPHTPEAILRLFIPEAASIIARVLMILSAGFLVFTFVATWKEKFPQLLWATCFTFALLPISGISSAKWNFIAQLPGFILIIDHLNKRWREGKWRIGLFIATSMILSWVAKYIELNYTIEGKELIFFDSIPVALLLVIGQFLIRDRDILTKKGKDTVLPLDS